MGSNQVPSCELGKIWLSRSFQRENSRITKTLLIMAKRVIEAKVTNAFHLPPGAPVPNPFPNPISFELNQSDPGEIPGGGSLTTRSAALWLILNYWQSSVTELKQVQQRLADAQANSVQQNPADVVLEQELLGRVVSVTFGKELLLLALAQSGVEALRFYIARKPVPEGAPAGTIGATTLVLAPVGADGHDLSAPGGKHSVLDWLEFDASRTVDWRATQAKLTGFEPLVEEVVPPYTLRDLWPSLSGQESLIPEARFTPNLRNFFQALHDADS